MTNTDYTGDASPGAVSISFPSYKQTQAFSQNKVVVLTYKPNGEVTGCEALPGTGGNLLGKNNSQGEHVWLEVSLGPLHRQLLFC